MRRIAIIAWTKRRDHPIVHWSKMVCCQTRSGCNPRPGDALISITTPGGLMQHSFRNFAAALALSAAPILAAAQPVPIVGLVELSGGGATVGTNFDNAIKLAVKEINAAGGL